MKRTYLLCIIAFMANIALYANHFVPAWHDPYQNPYLAMNIVVREAEVLGIPLTANDEIGIFDKGLLVGAVKLTQPLADYPDDCITINVSMVGGDVPGSATPGDFITFRVWVNATATEYAYPEMSTQFQYYYGSYNTVFVTQGTSFIQMLSYSTPTGTGQQSLIPPAGPGGGYVYNVSFPECGILLNQIYIRAGGGGIMSTYSFDTPTLDLSYSGTAPAHTLPYGWMVDTGNINYYATATYPIILKFHISDLTGVSNPAACLLYKRAIHGTAAFSPITTAYDAATGYLTASVTSGGEFILGSNDPANTLGNISGQVIQLGTALPIAGAEVSLGARTVQTDAQGHYLISLLSAGSHTLSFSAPGYQDTTATFILQANSTLTCNAALRLLPQIPDIPQSLVITRASRGFMLNWEAAALAESYRIYCSALPASGFSFLTETAGNSILLQDSFLVSQGVNPDQSFFHITACRLNR